MKEILKLIENVAPDDTDTLDEIDARVECYTCNEEYASHGKYTRSRDALKAIRPEGWWFDHLTATISSGEKRHLTTTHNIPAIGGYVLPTEELAELHAIIQAIQWERDNEGDAS